MAWAPTLPVWEFHHTGVSPHRLLSEARAALLPSLPAIALPYSFPLGSKIKLRKAGSDHTASLIQSHWSFFPLPNDTNQSISCEFRVQTRNFPVLHFKQPKFLLNCVAYVWESPAWHCPFLFLRFYSSCLSKHCHRSPTKLNSVWSLNSRLSVCLLCIWFVHVQ